MRRERTTLRRALLRWYDAKRRALPWRRHRDSYRIWVAEVMLQQTRVDVVVPAYRRFVRSLPTLARLAAASEEEVLSLWSGLGYYARARALHRAARHLVTGGARRFPDDYDAARALPGVGAYTAAAVLSIAYGQPYAAVDSNAVRVLSRLECLQRPDSKGEPHVSVAAELLDRERPGDWNQALMELGETVCLPKAPACGQCPVRVHCRAFARNRVERHPPPRTRRRVERIDLTVTVVHDGDGRLLLERGRFPFLPRLWLPPIEIGAPRNGRAPAGTLRHTIAHRSFRGHLFVRRVSTQRLRRLAQAGDHEREIFAPGELERIGRSSLLTKALSAVGCDHWVP